jgi:acylpyruvate hydrolase
MKLITFRPPNAHAPTIGGLIDGDIAIDLPAVTEGALPENMLDFLAGGEDAMAVARRALDAAAGRTDGPGTYPLDEIELLAPVPRPGKIIHTACNFVSHLEELTTWKAPEWQAHDWSTFHFDHPTGFLQAPSSVVGTGARVARPVFTQQLDFEVEMAIVIGRTAHNVDVEEALDYVAGYTVFNDLSARDIQAREHANKVILLGKSFDGSCPLGPWLTTRDEIADPTDLAMKLFVNGEMRQDSSTKHMKTKPAELVAWWSHITLEPGDVITSGSVPGVAAGMDEPKWLQPGDKVDAVVEPLGTLTTFIVEHPR